MATIQPELIPATDKNWKKEDALVQVTPATLLQSAAERGASPQELKEWMELYREWKKDNALEAYVADMAAFKASPPEIHKNKHVKFGNTEYDHATLDHVTDTIAQALSRHGFSHRWDVNQADGKIRVTCVITHKLGHSERTPLEGIADTSGSKNAIQAIGSAVTYLQRYTLLSATGLAAKNTDDDAAGTTALPDVQKRIEEILKASADDLNSTFTKHYQTAKKEGAKKSMLDLIEARDFRRGELRGQQ